MSDARPVGRASGAARRRALHKLVVAAGLVPAALLALRAGLGRLGADPVETLQHETGEWALRLLLATLAVTPLRRWLRATALAPYRRTLGLLAFSYASLHFAIFLVLDLAGDLRALADEVAERPWITVGFTGFCLLVPLAATSTRAAARRLGRRWKRLHRLVYLAAACGVVHFLWLVKADLREPLLYAAVLAALLLARVAFWARRSARLGGAAALRPGG